MSDYERLGQDISG